MTELVQYNAMRQQVQTCAKIDEAKDILDKAAAIRAYALQKNDKQLLTWMTKIQRRAEIRIGELSIALDKAETHGGKTRLPSAGKSKSDVLKEAGVSTSAAHRFEKIAGGDDPEAIVIARDVHEKALADDAPAPTAAALKTEVETAIKSNGLSVAKKREAPQPPDRRAKEFKTGAYMINDIESFDDDVIARAKVITSNEVRELIMRAQGVLHAIEALEAVEKSAA
jgi:hypothetical protein